MNRKISLVTAIGVAALAIGAPTAFGEGKLAGSQPSALPQPDPMVEDGESHGPLLGDGFARPVATKATVEDGESHGPLLGNGFARPVATMVAPSTLVSERTPESQWLRAERARSEGLNREYGLGDYATVNGYVGGPERASPPAGTAYVSTIDSGTGIEWPSIGVGFGVGILLALGLMVTLRYARVRQPAH
jgi:hypothetical protein